MFFQFNFNFHVNFHFMGRAITDVTLSKTLNLQPKKKVSKDCHWFCAFHIFLKFLIKIAIIGVNYPLSAGV